MAKRTRKQQERRARIQEVLSERQMFTINPDDFVESQWMELYNAQNVFTQMNEEHYNATPITASRGKIESTILSLQNKIKSLEDGILGPEESDGDDVRWIEDLQGAAKVLARYIGITLETKNNVRLTKRELATVLAALHYWQWKGLNGPIDGDQHQAIHVIAADAGDQLTEEEIDALAERINV